jgi:uncharacterized membrane protein YfcA
MKINTTLATVLILAGSASTAYLVNGRDLFSTALIVLAAVFAATLLGMSVERTMLSDIGSRE